MRYEDAMAARDAHSVDMSAVRNVPGGTGGAPATNRRSAQPVSGRDVRPMNG